MRIATQEIKDKIKEMVKEEVKELKLSKHAISFLEKYYIKKYEKEEIEINLGE